MKWYWKAHRMDERGNFSFVLLIVIIIRTASSWLQQQHNTTLRSTIFLKCWHSFCWFICLYSVVAWYSLLFSFPFIFVRRVSKLEICVYIRFLVLCMARTSGPLSLICLIFIMPFYTNVTSVCDYLHRI